jgi:hypothetical protein
MCNCGGGGGGNYYYNTTSVRYPSNNYHKGHKVTKETKCCGKKKCKKCCNKKSKGKYVKDLFFTSSSLNERPLYPYTLLSSFR